MTSAPELIDFSLASLRRMQLSDGAFCQELVAGESVPRGASPRYTLMVLLGLLKARSAGYGVAFDLDAIADRVDTALDGSPLTAGDLGLCLWVDARTGGDRAEELAIRLARTLDATGGLAQLLGMELGWIVTGLAQQVAARDAPAIRQLLDSALDQLLVRNRGPADLFFHHGGQGSRRRFPNFATQIYSVHALAVAGRLGLDARALPAARACADRLLSLQLADGGWPWVFDAASGRVVERYEIYSVHQDAMAPMALLELAEATGDTRYQDAALAGVRWITGANELGQDMVDRSNGIVYRSIRRRRPWSRLCLYANTGLALAGRTPRAGRGRLVELNRTDRPYHFGWVLEAWCGREAALARA